MTVLMSGDLDKLIRETTYEPLNPDRVVDVVFDKIVALTNEAKEATLRGDFSGATKLLTRVTWLSTDAIFTVENISVSKKSRSHVDAEDFADWQAPKVAGVLQIPVSEDAE